jgi:gliding motility-associatede transport system auxiliary component
MLRRLGDWGGWVGLAALAAAVLVAFVNRPEWARFRWPFVVAGAVLVLLSLIARVQNWRGKLGHRSTRYGFNAAVGVLIVFGVVGLVEALSVRHNWRWDLTENKRYSLSPQTIQLLGNLKGDVAATGFFQTSQPSQSRAEDLLRQFARYSKGHFTWKIVDPDREPQLARRYGVDAYETIVLEAGARSEKVTGPEEEKLTNALVKLSREGKRVIYVVQGHGEHELQSTDRPGFSQAKEAMEKANYEVKPLVLARDGKVPDDAAVVIVPGPRTDLLAPEIDALDAYLGRGGKLLVMVDPVTAPNQRDPEALKRFLSRYGFDVGNNLVIETNPIGRLFGIGPEVPIVQQYDPHPITRDMSGITTLFPLTRSISAAKTPPTGITVQPLAQTSPQSWGETDFQALMRGEAKPDPQDPKGPLPVAAVATKDKARVVVYGTSNLAANQFLNVQGDRDFFLNTVSWLAEEEDQIAIRPKDTRQTPIFMSTQQGQAVFWLPVVVLPALAVVGGVAAVVRRRAAK